MIIRGLRKSRISLVKSSLVFVLVEGSLLAALNLFLYGMVYRAGSAEWRKAYFSVEDARLYKGTKIWHITIKAHVTIANPQPPHRQQTYKYFILIYSK